MPHYLVTGCAGFIGAKVAELLLAGGHRVTGIDNLNDAYDVRLKEWRLAQLMGTAGFEFHRTDICDRLALQGLFEQGMHRLPLSRGAAGQGSESEISSTALLSCPSAPFDAVINLAARAGVRQSVQDPWCYFETNVAGTLNLLELCRTHRVNKFILASSSSLYGRDSPMPFCEDADTNHPLSPYAASKKAAEVLCHTYHYLYGIDVTVFRYFTVYGPAGRPDMSLFRFVQWISEGKPVTVFGDGRQSRDFTYVDDIARATIAGLGALGYEVINLGSDEPVVLADAIRMIEGELGQRACVENRSMHPADVRATWADISKASALLGWRPRQKFADGVHALVEWYRENREWASEIITAWPNPGPTPSTTEHNVG